MVPLCSDVRAGVASAGSFCGTEWTACLAMARAMARHGGPAVLLPSRALGAQPKDMLLASESHVVRAIPMSCIALVVPLCQERVPALCKGWVLSLPSSCLARWATT